MTTLYAEISFRHAGQLFLFDSGNFELDTGERVVVETEHGTALGTVMRVKQPQQSPPANFKLYKILRRASEHDLEREQVHQKREKEAFEFCQERIVQHRLTMKLVRAEYLFSGSKLLFYFSAEGRIDFRSLVRDLARHFRMRIEMRQIGVRDSAKLIGGIGPCGQELCCSRFLRDFNPVSIRMAKDQNLTLNPQKVSGVCGRLMCCLSYEQDVYQEMRQVMPRVGRRVMTPDGEGMVREINVFSRQVRVAFPDASEPYEAEFSLAQLPEYKEGAELLNEPLSQSKKKTRKRVRRGIEPLMEPKHQKKGYPRDEGRSRSSRRERSDRQRQDQEIVNPRVKRKDRGGGKAAPSRDVSVVKERSEKRTPVSKPQVEVVGHVELTPAVRQAAKQRLLPIDLDERNTASAKAVTQELEQAQDKARRNKESVQEALSTLVQSEQAKQVVVEESSHIEMVIEQDRVVEVLIEESSHAEVVVEESERASRVIVDTKETVHVETDPEHPERVKKKVDSSSRVETQTLDPQEKGREGERKRGRRRRGSRGRRRRGRDRQGEATPHLSDANQKSKPAAPASMKTTTQASVEPRSSSSSSAKTGTAEHTPVAKDASGKVEQKQQARRGRRRRNRKKRND